MSRKTLLITIGTLLVAAFLLGFIPQYMKGRDLNQQLGAAQQQLNLERQKAQMDELGLLCGHIYLETSEKNFGLASQYSSQFFDKVQVMMSQSPDPARQSFLQAALAQRDSITGKLAAGDPGAASAVQDLLQRTLEALENPSK